MKISLYFVLMTIAVGQVFGTQFYLTDSQKEVPTNGWGAATYNTQISIGLKSDKNEFKTNQVIELLVRVKNLSTNEEYGIVVGTPFTSSEVISFDLVLPSGKEMSLAYHDSGFTFSGLLIWVHPNQINGFGFNLDEICKSNEIGTYKIIMKMKRFTPDRRKSFEIISNPLYIAVVKQ